LLQEFCLTRRSIGLVFAIGQRVLPLVRKAPETQHVARPRNEPRAKNKRKLPTKLRTVKAK
jgi:hypothetical protein